MAEMGKRGPAMHLSSTMYSPRAPHLPIIPVSAITMSRARLYFAQSSLPRLRPRAFLFLCGSFVLSLSGHCRCRSSFLLRFTLHHFRQSDLLHLILTPSCLPSGHPTRSGFPPTLMPAVDSLYFDSFVVIVY